MKSESNFGQVDKFAVFSVSCLALSVSFGVALVSLSCLLMVISAVMVYIRRKDWQVATVDAINEIFSLKKIHTSGAVLLAISWIVISSSWSIATWHQIGVELVRSSRLLVIPLVLYLIRDTRSATTVLNLWVLGQIFIILNSYALWLGVQIPWATSDDATKYFTPYTTTLDQPIMSSVTFAVIWFYRDHFSEMWSKYLFKGNQFISYALTISLLILIFCNVSFLMIGRSGMLSLVIVVTLIGWWTLPKSFRKYSILIPVLISALLFAISPKFHDRIQAIPNEVIDYQKGNLDTSQAIRLEFWHRSLQAVVEKPILGYGVGSWPLAYIIALKGDKGIKADSPHQQFLLWWVEEGTVGCFLLLFIFYSILRDAKRLEIQARRSLICLSAVLFFTSLMNCPLQGAGISEFFCIMIGTLLVLKKYS